MAQNMLEEYRKRIMLFEESEYSYEQSKELVEYCLNAAKDIPIKLPELLTSAEARQYEDVEEIISALPGVIHEWYNKGQIPISVLAPDAVLMRRAEEANTQYSEDKNVEFIYVKADGSMKKDGSIDAVILLCPSRFHSLQFAAISKHKAADIHVLLLEDADANKLPDAIAQNDRERLEFLAARFEIETRPDLKHQRLKDLYCQFYAMIGGEAK